MSAHEQRDYYVYTYASSLDGKIFYVGKGKGDRYLEHVKAARRKDILYISGYKKPTRVVSTIRAIWQQGGKVIIRKPYKDLPEREAIDTEGRLIASYGFGQLVNQHNHTQYD